jgi:bacterioferritin
MRPLRPLDPQDHGRSSGRCRLPGRLLLRRPSRQSLKNYRFRPDGARVDRAPYTLAPFQNIAERGRSDAVSSLKRISAMKGDAKVIEYLNKALRHELTAVNQYWLHYRLLDNWGLKDLAKQWRKESIEEMEHADKLIERIIFFDGFPNLQVLDPLHIGQNVKEVLDCDLGAEMSARALYQEAATYCQTAKDYVTRDLFEKLMSDEEHHIDFLETQLDLVSRLGVELYSQHHIGEMGEGD